MLFRSVFTEDILTANDVVRTMMHGERSERTMAMLRSHISRIMEESLIIQLITQAATGPEGYADLKDAALEKAIQYTEELAEDSRFNELPAQQIQAMMHEHISSQPPAQFQNLIRPIFREDEWILVAIGGALGALAGWGQLVLLFGERLI